jgi:hypothetical protein
MQDAAAPVVGASRLIRSLQSWSSRAVKSPPPLPPKRIKPVPLNTRAFADRITAARKQNNNKVSSLTLFCWELGMSWNSRSPATFELDLKPRTLSCAMALTSHVVLQGPRGAASGKFVAVDDTQEPPAPAPAQAEANPTADPQTPVRPCDEAQSRGLITRYKSVGLLGDGMCNH